MNTKWLQRSMSCLYHVPTIVAHKGTHFRSHKILDSTLFLFFRQWRATSMIIICYRLQCYFTPMSRSAMTIILQWSPATLQYAIQHTINIIVLIMKRSSHQWSAVTHPIDNNDKEYWSSLQWSAVIPRQRIYIYLFHTYYATYRPTKPT